MRKEGNDLFNGTLNTFYLQLYGIRHFVKDHRERRKETFYLMMYSTHFIYSYMASDIWLRTTEKEGNISFNDVLNTFYLQLYGIRYMVKEYREQKKKGNVLFKDVLNTFYLRLYGVGHIVKLLPHGLCFLISTKCSFYMHHPTDRIAHTTVFVTPVVERWLERNSSMGPRWMVIWHQV